MLIINHHWIIDGSLDSKEKKTKTPYSGSYRSCLPLAICLYSCDKSHPSPGRMSCVAPSPELLMEEVVWGTWRLLVSPGQSQVRAMCLNYSELRALADDYCSVLFNKSFIFNTDVLAVHLQQILCVFCRLELAACFWNQVNVGWDEFICRAVVSEGIVAFYLYLVSWLVLLPVFTWTVFLPNRRVKGRTVVLVSGLRSERRQ